MSRIEMTEILRRVSRIEGIAMAIPDNKIKMAILDQIELVSQLLVKEMTEEEGYYD